MIQRVHLNRGQRLLCGERNREAHSMSIIDYQRYGIEALLTGEEFCSECLARFRETHLASET
jgi:hypothetical protein